MFLSLFVLLSISTRAENEVAQVGTTKYATLQEAIDAASGDNPTVSLLSNVTLNQTVTIGKSLTLDLVDYKIEAVDVRAFHITAGTVVFKRSGTKQGYIKANPATENSTFDEGSSVIRVGNNNGTEGTQVKLTIEDGVKVQSDYCYGVTVFGSKTKETLIINGSVTTWGNESAISGNGSTGYGGTDITINGTVTSYGTYSIYHPQDGKLTINGTVGSGTTKQPYAAGIEAKAGTIVINEGACVFAGATPTLSHEPYTNGPSTTGYAIAVVENNKYASGTNVTIDFANSGKISGEIAVLTDEGYGFTDESKKGKILIKNGKFSKEPKAEYVESGKTVAKGKSLWFVCDNSQIVAKNGEYQYPFFSEAFSDLGKNETLQLLADVSTTSQLKWMASKSGSTIDLNGHKLNYAGTSIIKGGIIFVYHASSMTITDTSSGNNGEINCGANAYAAIQIGSSSTSTKPATLTIEGGNIVGNYYAISGNGTCHNTEINIKGGKIKATNGNGNHAIYHPQDGLLNISGGEFEGSNTAIELRAGTMKVSGGSFKSTSNSYSLGPNGSGTTVEGSAIAIAQHTTKKDINVNIESGTFTGYNGICIVNPQNNETENVVVNIKGGTIEATNKAILAQYGNLNISGGNMKGDIATKNDENDNNNRTGNIIIVGGKFSNQPAATYIAGCCEVKNSGDTTYPYTIGVTETTENTVITKVDSDITSTDGQTGLGETEKTAVNDVINNISDENKTTNVNDVVNTDANTDDGNALIDLLKSSAPSNVAENVTSENITTSVNIVLKAADVQSTAEGSEGSKIVKKMVFDIKPVATVIVNKAPVAAAIVPNNLIKKNIKFRLPVDKSATDQFVKMLHNGKFMSYLPVQTVYTDENKSTVNEKYVEVETKEFSTFEYELTANAEQMEYYQGNSTKETMALNNVEWAKKLAECPNAVAVVNSEYADFANANNNVIVKTTVEGSDTYTCPNFVLTDANDLYLPLDFTATSVTYTRTFANNDFNALYLPFGVAVSQLTDCSVYAINMFHQSEGEEGTINLFLEVLKAKDTDNTLANHPYMVKYSGDTETPATFTFTGVSVTKTPETASVFKCSSMYYDFTFQGIYNKMENASSVYALGKDDTTGETALINPKNGLNAQRWYMTMTERESQFNGASKAKVVFSIIGGGDGETTGVHELENTNGECEYFTIDGRRTTNAAKGLKIKRIKNGKTVKQFN